MRVMVSMRFLLEHGAEIQARVPAEQAHVKELRDKGVIDVLYLAADSSCGWLVMNGESVEQVQQTMQGFPLAPYMELSFTALR